MDKLETIEKLVEIRKELPEDLVTDAIVYQIIEKVIAVDDRFKRSFSLEDLNFIVQIISDKL